MNQRPQTIQIFLPEGDPRGLGLRVAEITSRNIKALQVPRSQVENLLARTEAKQPACYFLFGESADGYKAYIGQTEDMKQRIGCHDDKKDFWSQLIMVVSGTHAFTQTHIRYLEWLAINSAKKAARYELDNGNGGTKPYAPEAIEADILDAFGTIGILLSTLGFPLFEPFTKVQAEGAENSGTDLVRPKFYCSGAGMEASGEWAPEGFILHAGSMVRGELVASILSNTGFVKKRQRLIDDERLKVRSDGHFEIADALVVSSPSFAASLVLGRPSNGWDAWATEDGATLDAVYRKTESKLNEIP